jgi:hypothetical protein
MAPKKSVPMFGLPSRPHLNLASPESFVLSTSSFPSNISGLQFGHTYPISQDLAQKKTAVFSLSKLADTD